MLPGTPNHEDIRKLLLENQKLLIDNNKLLRKMRRDAIIGFVFKIVWLVIALGVPFYLYFYYIQPHIGSIQEQASLFKQLTDSEFDPQSWSNIFNRGNQ
ncbi:MAG TPA: hypothetical protein PKA42_03005 [Candidatus Paceibacterota bacterium]|nr:hypothetical protein [Candidatus Paceibacterota bacterium]HMO83114.1 hypothetical protein [Candidatus Paceibacterota bacterium]